MDDTTTFVPPTSEPEYEDNDPTGSFPGLTPIKATAVWKCRVCGYAPVDEATGKCYNCGRDFVGEPRGVPPARDKPPRAGVRSDGR